VPVLLFVVVCVKVDPVVVVVFELV
jgi:hypothetical protein